MRKHVKNAITMHDPTLTEDPECAQFYGTEGNLDVGPYHTEENQLTGLLEMAAKVHGYTQLKDVNCGQYIGFTRLRGTVFGGERQSAAKAFLAPLRDQKNLLILQNAVVDKVIIDESSGFDRVKVKGVRIVTQNEECPSFELRAKNEIILSAGGFNTPLILQRSGIGRVADLKPFNIRQKLNLNVGHNYRDHLISVHIITIPFPPFTDEQVQQEATRYFTERKGQFSQLSTLDFGVFHNHDNPNSKIPDNQWLFLSFATQQQEIEQILKYHLEMKNEFANQIISLNQENVVILLANSLSLPKSSGYVGLRSTNPYDEPKIKSNFLSEEDDYQLMFKAIDEIKRFIDSPVMKQANATVQKLNIPECNSIEYGSDNYWRCYLKYFTQTMWHPSGTARMGNKKDKNAVVDSKLKVIGVHGKPGLRISDASAFPQVPTGNPQCTVYALADRAAQIIIEDNL